MFMNNWKKEFLTIPNMLSLFRLTLIPVYIFIYLTADGPSDHFIAAAILAVSCLTDLLDGKIARHFDMVSTVGKILDPVADKLTQFTLMVCLSIKHPTLRTVLILFVIKESFQSIAGLIHLRRGRMLSGALIAGKICTAVLFVSLILLVLIPEPSSRLVTSIAWIDMIFLIYSFICYILAYACKDTRIQDL